MHTRDGHLNVDCHHFTPQRTLSSAQHTAVTVAALQQKKHPHCLTCRCMLSPLMAMWRCFRRKCSWSGDSHACSRLHALLLSRAHMSLTKWPPPPSKVGHLLERLRCCSASAAGSSVKEVTSHVTQGTAEFAKQAPGSGQGPSRVAKGVHRMPFTLIPRASCMQRTKTRAKAPMRSTAAAVARMVQRAGHKGAGLGVVYQYL